MFQKLKAIVSEPRLQRSLMFVEIYGAKKKYQSNGEKDRGHHVHVSGRVVFFAFVPIFFRRSICVAFRPSKHLLPLFVRLNSELRSTIRFTGTKAVFLRLNAAVIF